MSTADEQYDSLYKILVLGDSGVGKTSIINQFVSKEFLKSYLATIGIDSYSKHIDIQGERIKLQIWDTAGQERFRTLTNAYYRGAMGILLVYDVTAEYTFSNISSWVDMIRANASESSCELLLIGNKIDVDEDEIVVPTQRGKKKAADSSLSFYETSAKQGTNVEEAFMSLAESIYKSRKQQKLANQRGEAGRASVTLTKETQRSSCC